jgi:Acetyltransferase (GNAT) domain
MSDTKQVELPNPIFFTDEHEDFKLFKELIKKQGDCVYRKKLSNKTVSGAIQRLEFGYISYGTKASIGQHIKNSNDKYLVYGFVLCHIEHDIIMHIDLLCISCRYKGAGANLMERIINHAQSINISQIKLYALPELHKYYEKHGFNTVDTIRQNNDPKSEVKVYEMRRLIL